jgi:hypothetical protein
MLPAMFKLKKLGSVLENKAEALKEGDKENRTPTLKEGKAASIDHALTIPRLERAHNDMSEVSESTLVTPCFMSSTTLRSQSDPVPKVLRNVTNTLGRTPKVEPEVSALLVEIANSQKGSKKSELPKEPSSQLSPVKLKKRVKAEAHWSYTDDREGCASIKKDLGLSLDGEFDSPIDLFRHLERSSKYFNSHLILICGRNVVRKGAKIV